MARPRDIRRTIIANLTELEAFGVCARDALTTTALGGRPGMAFFLNEEQALLVCLLSNTEKTKEVRSQVIQVFTAYRRGLLVPLAQPQVPNFSNPAEAARAWADQYEQNLREPASESPDGLHVPG